MNWFINHLPVLPEIIVLVMSCVILLMAAFFKEVKYIAYLLSQVTLIAAVYSTLYAAHYVPHDATLFYNGFIWDRLAVLMKLVTYLGVFIIFMMTRQYNEEHDILTNEFYVLSLLSMLGMMVLISGDNLLTLYLGLELMSLPLYAMVALKRAKERCIEAAMKYFVMGALASGLLLYGFSFLFGLAHSLNLTAIAAILFNTSSQHVILIVFASIFVIAGIAFKLGAVPFHMWVPDVYDGAPNSVTLFLSSAPKLAAFVLLTRLLAGPLVSYSVQWYHVLLIIALLSIALGNIAAIAQSNIKRMLAYSSIAHMGYMLLGFCTLTERGYSAAMFYMITYVLVSIAAFGFLTSISRRGVEVTELADLSGLSRRNPWVSFMMLLVLFSLAGVPPMVGFIAKIGILEALIQAKLVWVAVVAILFAIVGVYYYIRVVKVMYFERVESDVAAAPALIYCATESYLAITLCGMAVLLLGIFPEWLFNLCRLTFS